MHDRSFGKITRGQSPCELTHLDLASLRGLSVSTIINQLILKALLKESYEKEKLTSIFFVDAKLW